MVPSFSLISGAVFPRRWVILCCFFSHSVLYLFCLRSGCICERAQEKRLTKAPVFWSCDPKGEPLGKQKLQRGEEGGAGKQYHGIIYELLNSLLSCICMDLTVIKIPDSLRTELTDRSPPTNPQWETDPNSTTKALKTETMESQLIEDGLDLAV